MPHWNEEQYVAKAQSIAAQHVRGKQPLSGLVEKVAADHAMNHDEIRTLSRLTNVAVFQEMFKIKTASEDRMIEFETVDPELIISRLVKTAATTQPTYATEIVRSSHELPDLRRPALEAEKVANDLVEEREAPAKLQVMRLRKLAEELNIEASINNQRWDAAVNALARNLKKVAGYGPAYEEFEKDAYAIRGMDALPEISALRTEMRMKAPEPDAVKVAALQERHLVASTPLTKLFEDACRARDNYVKLSAARDEVSRRLQALEAPRGRV